MSELFGMWRNTRMVVLTAISAALYAAALIAFKPLEFIPGVSGLRPGNALPVVFSLLFGPAGAWGTAIGNLIFDFFGGIGPGSIPGFIGNLLYGLVPYRLWRTVAPRLGDPVPSSPGKVAVLGVAIVAASATCAMTIATGLQALGFAPFRVLLGNLIVVNNTACSLALDFFLLHALYPRVAAQGLTYRDIAPERPRRFTALRLVAALGVVAAAGAGMVLVNHAPASPAGTLSLAVPVAAVAALVLFL